MTLLRAQGICCVRAGRRILDGIDVSAHSGEFIAVIGPNGAGKSTLLATLAGLLAPEQGDVMLEGRLLRDYSARELALRRAFLPQNPRSEWPIAVWRLVGLGLTPTLPAWGDFTTADRARIDAALAACDLTAQREQAVTTLSGGELARAMLARALVSNPDVLIVDEPLAGLDPRHAVDAARRLQQLAAEQGKLVIATMHDLNVALRRATRVWMLKDGKLAADGAPAAAMSASLLQEVFGIAARIRGAGVEASVDFGA
jgi:iron complex transport system ATP-binding protein